MINYKDNFLPDTVFSNLQKKMLKKFKPGIREDFGYWNKENVAVRLGRSLIKNNDLTDAKVFLGLEVVPAIEQILSFVVSEYNFNNPIPYATWFQYMNSSQSVGKHIDGTVNGKPLEKSFSGFIYMNEYWEDDWGGEFCVEGTEVLPKRNRLLIYSRDQEHWVNPIIGPDKDYNRMFFALSFSID